MGETDRLKAREDCVLHLPFVFESEPRKIDSSTGTRDTGADNASADSGKPQKRDGGLQYENFW